MREGTSRKVHVRLLDGNSLHLEVQSSTSCQSLRTEIHALCGIEEPDSQLFGLAIIDKLGQFNWLPDDSKETTEETELIDRIVNEDLILNHRVRYFLDSCLSCVHPLTIELYFMDVHLQILRDEIILEERDYLQVAANLLQAYIGDSNGDLPSVDALRHLLPKRPRALFRKPSSKMIDESVSEVERLILERYLRLRGMPRGHAIIKVMEIVERCATYGSRFYCVRDGISDEQVTIAVNSRGIFVYNVADFLEPIQWFEWRDLDNLYYKETEFSLGIKSRNSNQLSTQSTSKDQERDEELQKAFNDPTTKFNSVQRRGRPPIGAPQNNQLRPISQQGTSPGSPPSSRSSLIESSSLVGGTHSVLFRCDSHSLCRALWAAAVSQHKFYLNKKSRSTAHTSVTAGEVGEKLDRLVSRSSIASSLPSLSSLHSTSSSSMPSARVADGSSTNSLPSLKSAPSLEFKHFKIKTAEDQARDVTRYRVLLKKRADTEVILIEKLSKLKELCIQEGEMIGEMPVEMKLALMPGEEVPKLKRRIGTSFLLPKEFIRSQKADAISQLETDIEIHKRIVAAADRLAKDHKTNKSVRKKRQKDLQAAAARLKGMELQLAQMRFSASKPDISTDANHNEWGNRASPSMNHRLMAQSCPTTPRGSIPDLRGDDDGEPSEYEEERDSASRDRRRPSSVASSSRAALSSNRFSEASTCSAFSMPLNQGSSQSSLSQSVLIQQGGSPQQGGLPPKGGRGVQTMPRSITHSDHLDNATNRQPLPLYENVGYRSSAAYQSAYRQSHYPTLHEQQISRQRAKSEHSLVNNQSAVLNADWTPKKAQQRIIQAPVIQQNGSPIKQMTLSPPMIRMQTSHSCSAGFSTASLDRKALRNRPSPGSPLVDGHQSRGLQMHPLPPHNQSMSRDQSPSTQRVTTFPVGTKGLFYETTKPFGSTNSSPLTATRVLQPQRFPITHSAPQFPPFHHSPQSLMRQNPVTHSSSGLQIPQNPRMEALLDYYKEHDRKPSKTATIV